MPLHLVATPIGNLKDITLRALEVLKSADLLACEDTRVTSKLLAHYGIRKPLMSYNDHNAARQRPRIFEHLEEGKSVALISDAGTPLISDPGYKLVQEAVEKNYKVIPIPGPCALIAALTLSGLPTDRFLFLGFLPTKSGERKRLLETFRAVPATLVFYESANRLEASLAAMAGILGERETCVAREITKLHEEARRGTLSMLAEHYLLAGAPRGEIVIVVAPPQGEEEPDETDIEEALRQALAAMSLKDAVAAVADQFRQPRKEIYTIALALPKKP